MSNERTTPRILQQQPARESDPQQQRAGATDFQSRSQQQQSQSQSQGGQPQMGEGSYEGTRDYQKNIKDYLDKADVQSDAEQAKPRSEQEARELDDAEREGRSHSKGER
jgi:hypothetical protein